MDCNAKMADHMCFWSTGGEFVSIIRPFEAAAHLICCVVIATNHGDAYVSLVESCKAGDEFKAALIVTPVAVENVAGDHNKIDFFVDSESDHFPKSAQSLRRQYPRLGCQRVLAARSGGCRDEDRRRE